jgi:hypothetical protein
MTASATKCHKMHSHSIEEATWKNERVRRDARCLRISTSQRRNLAVFLGLVTVTVTFDLSSTKALVEIQ